MNILMMVLATIGMSHIVVDGSIFEEPRKLIKEYSRTFRSFPTWVKCLIMIVGILFCVFWTTFFGFVGLPYFGLLMLFLMLWSDFGAVVDCYLCSGTWAGFLMGYLWVTQNPFQIFACGCAGAFLSNLAALILQWIEAATIVNLPGDDE